MDEKDNPSEIENLKDRIRFLEETIDTQNITIEITNDRWVAQLNKNMQLEIELRKLKRNTI